MKEANGRICSREQGWFEKGDLWGFSVDLHGRVGKGHRGGED